MLFVMIEDGLNNLEILVFPRVYKENEAIWQEEKMIIAEGTLSDKDGEVKVLCNKIWVLEEATLADTIAKIAGTPYYEDKRKKFAMMNKDKAATEGKRQPLTKITINYPLGASKELAEKVKMLFMAIPGNNQVFLKIGDKLIKTDFCIALNDDSQPKIETLLGKNSITK